MDEFEFDEDELEFDEDYLEEYDDVEAVADAKLLLALDDDEDFYEALYEERLFSMRRILDVVANSYEDD